MEKSKKTVFVMGSSSGIGNSLIRTFIDREWKVYAGTSKSSELATNGTDLKIVPINFRNITSIEEMFLRLNEFVKTPIDALVCVSGVSEGGDFLSFTLEEWCSSININLLGPTILSRYFISKAVNNSQKLSIVYTSSLSAFKGANKPQYAATKAGLNGISSSISRKFGKDGIRSNIVVPGVVETNLISDWDDEKRKDISKNIPLGRIAFPQDVVELLYFLASDESSYISGQTIHINGGDFI